MKNLCKLFIVFFIAHFIACSNDEVDEKSFFTEDSTVANVFKVSEDEAKETLMSFLDQFDSNSSNVVRSTSKRTIKDIQAYNVNPTTRSSSDYDYEIPDDVETLFYLINFDNDQGFGIVSGDKRTTPVLAVVDEGSLSLDTLSRVKNTGFLMFLDQAVEMQMQEIVMIEDDGGGGGSGGSSNSTPTVILDLPIRLKTKWSQHSPYNKFAPNGVNGCVMTAAAQALSFFQTVGYVQWQDNNSYGSSVLNWSQIIADCEDLDGWYSGYSGYGKLIDSRHFQSALQVSHLMRFLGVVLNADYKSNGQTGADTGDAVKYLKNWCDLSSSTVLYNYDATGVRNALIQNSNCLIMARSHANRTNRFLGIIYTYEDGHAWIIDGLRRIRYGSSSSSSITDYVHCNWGWGGICDGYFVSGSFNTQVNPNFLGPNDENMGTGNYNFRYNKEYAVLSR
ncbi:C10 family peptidase [Dysgonomonadaceae bacterium zrk40]|nr:C10 family peptidase [Dysgonomonadaceae bacterium zrk40]